MRYFEFAVVFSCRRSTLFGASFQGVVFEISYVTYYDIICKLIQVILNFPIVFDCHRFILERYLCAPIAQDVMGAIGFNFNLN